MSKTELPTAIDSSWYGEMFVKVVTKISQNILSKLQNILWNCSISSVSSTDEI